MTNTCYLSAAMQCLTHTEALKHFFVSQAFKTDINVGNPIGHQGLVADTFAEFMTLMWQVCSFVTVWSQHSSSSHDLSYSNMWACS